MQTAAVNTITLPTTAGTPSLHIANDGGAPSLQWGAAVHPSRHKKGLLLTI